MTPQAAFNIVYCEVLAQGGPSVASNGECRYRFNTRKCGVGHLISDKEYSSEMEGMGIHNLQGHYPELQLNELDIAFLSAIQSAHDATSDADPLDWEDEFRGNMKDLAERFDLEVPNV